MINNEILSFIKEQTTQGTAKDQIKNLLVTQGGWDEKDVEEAFETITFSGTSYPSMVKSAAANLSQGAEKKLGTVSSFAPFSSSAPAASAPSITPSSASQGGSVRPASFMPGLSHVEQPKVMEPSSPDAFNINTIKPAPAVRVMETIQPVQRPAAAQAPIADGTLNRLRERIASGVVAAPATPVVAPAQNIPLDQFKVNPLNRTANNASVQPVVSPRVQPIIKEPVVASTAVGASLGTDPKIAAVASGAVPPVASFQNISRNFGVASSPGAAPLIQTMPVSATPAQPVAVFPRSDVGSMPHITPTPAQLAALQAKAKQGGRFLLGLIMFLVGLLIGGLLMNAYMNGYVKKSALDSMTAKVMNLIGLDTPAPIPLTDVPETSPAPVEDSGS